MGDFGTSDCSWEKLTIAKSDNHELVSSVKTEQTEEINDGGHTTGFSFSGEHDPFSGCSGTQVCVLNSSQNGHYASYPMLADPRILLEAQVNRLAATPRRRKRPESASSIKNETDKERPARLAKMAYAAQRLAKETPEQRTVRLKRMSEYYARRLREETPEQRAKRLARRSANAAERLANESPEQRQERLKRMSEYYARRLREESPEQRAKRLALNSDRAYATAMRLANESPEQRQERLKRMSENAGKRHAQKKGSNAMDLWSEHKEFNNDAKYPKFYVIMPDQS